MSNRRRQKLSTLDASFARLMGDVILPGFRSTDGSPRLLAHLFSGVQQEIAGRCMTVMPAVLSSWQDLADPAKARQAAELPDQAAGSVDVFYSSDILDFLADIEGAITNAARVLKPGGYAAFRLKHNRILEGAMPPTIGYQIDPASVGLPPEATLPSMRVGRDWFLSTLVRAGLEARMFKYQNKKTSETVEWFVGRKFITFGATNAGPGLANGMYVCGICGSDLTGLPKGQTACPGCKSEPRTRSLVRLRERLLQMFPTESQPEERTLLAFGMNALEEHALVPSVFGHIRSVSLHGNSRRRGRVVGVDVRDLSRYPAASFDGVFGGPLFDDSAGYELALREIKRVLKPGGVLFTHIASRRLHADDKALPQRITVIERAKNRIARFCLQFESLFEGTTTPRRSRGYFGRLLDDARMPLSKLGRTWFLDTIKRAGLEAKLVQLVDVPSNEKIDWFIGSRRMAGPNGSVPLRYSIPLPTETGYEKVDVTFSLPVVPAEWDMAFCEHIGDVTTGKPTNSVVLCGVGAIAVSDDLGMTWRKICTTGFEDYNWCNCFTTSTGRHIIQSYGWLDSSEPAANSKRQAATLLIFDQDWNFVARAEAGEGNWHGTASIGESGGTIMFGEYFSNHERYHSDFEAKKAEFLKKLRPNAIWRSRDDGATWHKVLEFGPLEIRHFHTVIPDRFLPGTWWASSGDLPSECRVWRTDNDGDDWLEVTNKEPDIRLPAAFSSFRVKCQRYTDTIIERDQLIWGADDYLGSLSALNDQLPIGERAGSRIYASPKTTPLQPREIAWIGHPVRKLIDVGPGWIIVTEAKQPLDGYRPNVSLLFKDSLRFVKLVDLKSWGDVPTGFTYSRGSKEAKDGCFFTYRSSQDVFEGGSRCLKWQVEFK